MKTIQELRAAGLTLADAKGCAGCTRIESAEPFYYVNPRFCDRPEDIAEKLEAAEQEGDRYGFILAGDYHSGPASIELPFELVSVQARNDIVSHYESMREAEMNAVRRRTNFYDTVKQHIKS